jgi:hypothetical protein
VVLSSHGPEYEEAYPPETWFWLAMERAVERSGMEWTHIRPSAVMGAMIEGTYPATGSDWPDTIRGERVVREAFLDSGHYPFIHSAARCAASTTGPRSMPVCSAEGAMTGGRPSPAGRPRARTAPTPRYRQ